MIKTDTRNLYNRRYNLNKIFIHGLGQTDKSWNNVTTELNNINSKCPNLKTLLGSKDVTFNNLYEAFSQYCDKFSDKIDLCGISLGGMLALKYTFNNPQKVNSLVLIGTQYKIPKLLFSLQGSVFRCLPNSVFGSMGFTKKDFITLTTSMKNIDFSKDLLNVNCKTLVICGKKDSANMKASNALHKIIKSSEITLVANSKHEVNTDAPIQLSKILLKFYNEM